MRPVGVLVVLAAVLWAASAVRVKDHSDGSLGPSVDPRHLVLGASYDFVEAPKGATRKHTPSRHSAHSGSDGDDTMLRNIQLPDDTATLAADARGGTVDLAERRIVPSVQARPHVDGEQGGSDGGTPHSSSGDLELGGLSMDLAEERKEITAVQDAIDGQRSKLTGSEDAEIGDEKEAEKAKDKVILNQKTMISMLEHGRDKEERALSKQQGLIDTLTASLRSLKQEERLGADEKVKALKQELEEKTGDLAQERVAEANLKAKVASLQAQLSSLEDKLDASAKEQESKAADIARDEEKAGMEKQAAEEEKAHARSDEDDVSRQRQRLEDEEAKMRQQSEANEQEKTNLDRTLASLTSRAAQLDTRERAIVEGEEEIQRNLKRGDATSVAAQTTDTGAKGGARRQEHGTKPSFLGRLKNAWKSLKAHLHLH